jgi:hypothetical protein
MLGRVANALDAELRNEIAFVGGCVTALHVTDPVTRSAVRLTDDVDVMQQLGFRVSPEDEITCRMRLRDNQGPELIVDFMPDDPAILGFSNRWSRDALRTAVQHTLPNGMTVRVVDPPHFIGTKLEAFKGRGNNDLLGSRDIEDILNIVDGRASLLDELLATSPALRTYVGEHLQQLLLHNNIGYAVQSAAMGSPDREDLIFDRLERLAALRGI